MRFIVRRFVLGVGSALIAGGWGMTQYADEQRQAGGSTPASWWGPETTARAPAGSAANGDPKRLTDKIEWAAEGGVPSMWIFLWGVMAMAAGAGMLGWTIPRLRGDEWLDGDAEEPARPQHMRLPV